MSEQDAPGKAAAGGAQPGQMPEQAAGSGQPRPDQPRPDQARPDLAAAVAELREQLAQCQDQRMRALADVENVRKRAATQVSRAEADTRARVAAQWLPVVDNLERALHHSAAEPGAIVEGIRSVLNEALGVLAALGFPQRDDKGTAFDPASHEAVASRPDDGVPAGTVIDVTRPGYGEGEHQLRPAQVVVSRQD